MAWAVSVVVFAGIACTASSSVAQETVTPAIQNDAFEVQPGARVTLNAERATVTVTRSPDNVVRIDSEIIDAAGINYYALPRTGLPTSHLDVSAKLRSSQNTTASSKINLQVPEGITLEVRTTAGAIELEGLSLPEATLNTTDASVTVRDASGRFNIRSVNGTLVMERFDGTVWAHADEAVTFDGTIRGSRSNRLNSTNGAIVVRMTDDSNVTARITAEEGEITTEGLADVRGSGNSVTGTAGAGEGTLEVKSDHGSVNVHFGAESAVLQ